MVNTEDFIKRLEIILDYYSINASTFADKIGVQRSSLSHLLSGRNKPSLDFILKILEEYPDVDLYWILNGKGNFPKNGDKDLVVENSVTPKLKSNHTIPTAASSIPENLFSQNENDKESFPNVESEIISGDVDKIVFFYKDGTFKIFKPQ
ncbi:helix-turn-helix domain-containing protein [Flavobacterium sp. WC2430]|uniref:helix-turn-helix domain-containing protein n=1 Tax=Flavobacterium sp. WC2430 TaxID=3234137 RepID=UPI0034658AC1